MGRIGLRVAGILLLAVTLLGGAGTAGVGAQEATPAGGAADCPTTTPEENVAVARRWHEEAINGHDLSVLDEIVAPEIMHDSGTFPDDPGPNVVLSALLTGFPDVMQTVEQVVAEGDLVAVRFTSTGTQTGELQGLAATGRTATWTGINVFRIECGRIAEVWTEVDGLGRLQQLGVLPTPAGDTMAEPATTAATPESCPTSTPDQNKELVGRWFDEVWSGGGVDILDELLAAGHNHHWAIGPDTSGVDPIKERVTMWRTTLPDLTFTADPVIAEGDLVAARWTGTGTDQGGFMGSPPTGQTVQLEGINVFRIECGQIVEVWSEMDGIGFLEQIGAMDAMMAMATPEP